MDAGKTAVIRAAGEVGEKEMQAIQAAARRRFDAGDKAVLLDFTEVDYLTEEAMAELLWLNRDVRARGERLVLCCFIAYLAHKLQRMGLTDVLPIYADMPTALAAV